MEAIGITNVYKTIFAYSDMGSIFSMSHVCKQFYNEIDWEEIVYTIYTTIGRRELYYYKLHHKKCYDRFFISDWKNISHKEIFIYLNNNICSGCFEKRSDTGMDKDIQFNHIFNWTYICQGCSNFHPIYGEINKRTKQIYSKRMITALTSYDKKYKLSDIYI